ncbi:MAG: hypothetical protein ACTSP3_17205 [Candidatus Heimdallarchaeaceae archaeon]
MQKLIADALKETEIDWEKDVVAINPTGNTDEAFELIKSAFKE